MNKTIMNKLRSFAWSKRNVAQWFLWRYRFRSYIGLIRGKICALFGRVIYIGNHRHLIVGPNIDYDMGAGSYIVLETSNRNASSDPANIFYPTASSIGVFPSFNHMNPPITPPTRLRIRDDATLILHANTTILAGSYLAVWPEKNLIIGDDTYIAHGVCINTRCGMKIGRNVMIGHETTIMDYDGHPIFSINDEIAHYEDTYGGSASPICIEDNVWIGFKCTILKGVRIGEGTIIGANSCVTKSLPANCIAAGNPARVIKENIKWRKY